MQGNSNVTFLFDGFYKSGHICNIMGAISFSKRLKKVRCEKGFTQQKLAEIAGLSVTHVIRLESVKRKSNPTMDTIKRISKALGVPVETFMSLGGITHGS